MTFEKIGVVGSGQMGAGIAQVSAAAGMKVTLLDSSKQSLERATKSIDAGLRKMVEKGKITGESADKARASLNYTMHLEDLAQCNLVIEAINEQIDAKANLFKTLDSLCIDRTIFASNTSSISITQLASVTGRPDRFIGMHFMNPVPLMSLVEVIKGLKTSPETFEAVMRLGNQLGKVCVESRDFPGFIVNRVLMPMINEACFTVYEGIATAAGIDQAMKLGTNQPMGPLALADLIGLDTCLSILNVLHEGFGDSKYRACPLLKQMVAAGMLGRKTGEGFYKYE